MTENKKSQIFKKNHTLNKCYLNGMDDGKGKTSGKGHEITLI